MTDERTITVELSERELVALSRAADFLISALADVRLLHPSESGEQPAVVSAAMRLEVALMCEGIDP